MTPLRAVLTLLCLTVFATSAAADCAWVVWKDTLGTGEIGGQQREIQPMSAYTSQADCEREAARGHMTQGGSKDKVVRLPSGLEIRVNLLTSFFCLPDTVDPRGPKGK